MADVKEYKIGRAIVRIRGQVDQERLKKSTINFLKKAETKRKGVRKNNGNVNTA